MRKLITAGLATLLLVAAVPSQADAMGGGRRGRGAARAAKPTRSGASWAQPKASAKKRSGSAKKSVGATAKLPAVKVPALTAGGRRARPSLNTGSPSSASLARTTPKISVDYTPDPENKKTPKLVNGGLGGGGGAAVKKGGGGGGGKKHSVARKKGKRG